MQAVAGSLADRRFEVVHDDVRERDASAAVLDFARLPADAWLGALRALDMPIRDGHAFDPHATPTSAAHVRGFAKFWRRQRAAGLHDFAFVTQTVLEHRMDAEAVFGAIELHRQGVIELRVVDRDVAASTSLIHHLARFALDDAHEDDANGRDARNDDAHALPSTRLFETLSAAGFDLDAPETRAHASSTTDATGRAIDATWTTSPLGSAILQGNVGTARALMRLGRRFDARRHVGAESDTNTAVRYDAFELAGMHGLRDLAVDIAATLPLDIGKQECSSIYIAAKYGLLDALDALMKRGLSIDAVNCFGRTALQVAVEHRHAGAVDALLTRGADPNQLNAWGDPPLLVALSDGDEASAARLLREPATRIDEADGECRALSAAIGNGCARVAVELIERGARLSSVSLDGRCALYSAVALDQRDTAHALMNRHVDVDRSNDDGRRAIHAAAEERSGVWARWLVKHGAHVNFDRRNDVPPPLQCAVRAGAVGAVRELIAAGARVDLRDEDAARSWFRRVLECRRDGALSLAKKLGHHDVAYVLEHVASGDGIATPHRKDGAPDAAREPNTACGSKASRASALTRRVRRACALGATRML